MAQSHPPRVAQPEERSPIRVLEVPVIGGDSHRAVPVQWILAGVRRHRQFTAAVVEVVIRAVAADGPVFVLPGYWSRIAHRPDIFSGPERRHPLLVPRGILNDDVEFNVVERIPVLFPRNKAPLRRAILNRVSDFSAGGPAPCQRTGAGGTQKRSSGSHGRA